MHHVHMVYLYRPNNNTFGSKYKSSHVTNIFLISYNKYWICLITRQIGFKIFNFMHYSFLFHRTILFFIWLRSERYNHTNTLSQNVFIIDFIIIVKHWLIFNNILRWLWMEFFLVLFIYSWFIDNCSRHYLCFVE